MIPNTDCCCSFSSFSFPCRSFFTRSVICTAAETWRREHQSSSMKRNSQNWFYFITAPPTCLDKYAALSSTSCFSLLSRSPSCLSLSSSASLVCSATFSRPMRRFSLSSTSANVWASLRSSPSPSRSSSPIPTDSRNSRTSPSSFPWKGSRVPGTARVVKGSSGRPVDAAGGARSEELNISLSSLMEADDEARSRQASCRGMLWASIPRDKLCLWATVGLGSGRRTPGLELLTRACNIK